MNVNLYGCQGKWVMVDLGITFPDSGYPGVDVILPDLSFIEDRIDDLLGIVITHGHEDHIGSLPYLAEDLGVPIYATPFTMGLIRGKLEEEGIARRVKMKTIPMGGNFQLGPFGFTFVEMSHSIPEANALLIDTPHGRVFHTGDWKLDPTPVIGNPTKPDGFKAIGDKGVDVLVCDSTNVFNTTQSGSESDVRRGLSQEVAKAKGRVLVTSFASNASRLHTLGEVAKETGRKLCVTGRSLDRIVQVAHATGYLTKLPETIDPDTAMRLPKNKVLIVATGGQGEERAALARVANGKHPIRLDAEDTVIFSSKEIPGNEVAIGRIQNTLAAKGIRMVTERQAHVHVSGHPGQSELASMYEWLRPDTLIPTHGEMRHLMEHARFGLAQGVPRALVQSNGDIIRLMPKGPAKIGNATVGRLVLDGDVILPADGSSLEERRKLALDGQVSIAIAIGKDGKTFGQPQVSVQGIPVEEDRAAFIADLAAITVSTVRGGKRELDKLREQIRGAARKVTTRWTGKKPVIDVLLIEV